MSGICCVEVLFRRRNLLASAGRIKMNRTDFSVTSSCKNFSRRFLNVTKKRLCHAIVTIPPHGCNSVVSFCRRNLKPTTMKMKKQNTTKVALFAGATALMALTQNTRAQTSVDALLNKLEQKGVLTV